MTSSPLPGFYVAMDASLPPAAAPALPPAVLHEPSGRPGAAVFVSAHSGRAYPEALLAAARLDPDGLRRSEDVFVDELFAAATEHGAPLLAATFPRAWCDPNREAWELDPAMFEEGLPAWVNTTSPRVGAGLGTVPRVVANGEAIYRRKLRFDEARERIAACWMPFHAALQRLVTAARAAHGGCLLIDCHSMPSLQGGRGPDFVLGDAYGSACSPELTRLVEQALVDMGYTVRRNDPYAGGYITRHYGRPREGVHALQIEVARRLYLDEARFLKLPRFDALQRDLGDLTGLIARAAPALIAAQAAAPKKEAALARRQV